MTKSILLADDSLTIQKVIELTFSDTGYELTTVSNGDDALAALGRARPDLVLADVVMPGKNGYEVCEAIKSDPALSSIPVVLLSGTFEPFDRERAERARANAIVTKPFDSKNLLSQVESLLREAPEEASPPSVPVVRAGDEDFESVYAERQDALEITSTKLRPYVPEPPMAPKEAVEFDLDDTSPFGEVLPAPPPPPGEPDSVFEFASEPPFASAFPAEDEPLDGSESAAGVGLGPAEGAHEAEEAESAPGTAEEVTAAIPVLPPEPADQPMSADLERLAQTASLSDLAGMVSRMSSGASLSDEDVDRIAQKAVEKISDRVIREIAWEVIPELAEILVRKRIEELEAQASGESE
jgi:CheY-like chemotaxis protein